MNDAPQPSPAFIQHCQAMAAHVMAAPHYQLYHDFALSCLSTKTLTMVKGYEFISSDHGLAKKAGKEFAHLVAKSADAKEIAAHPETEAGLAVGGLLDGLLRDRDGETEAGPKTLRAKLATFFAQHPQQAELTSGLLRRSPYRDYFAKTLTRDPTSLADACRDYFDHASRADCAILGYGMLGAAPPAGLYAVSAGEDKSWRLSTAYLEAQKHPQPAAPAMPALPKELIAFVKRICQPDAAPMLEQWNKERIAAAADKRITEHEIQTLLNHVRADVQPLGLKPEIVDVGLNYMEKGLHQQDSLLRQPPPAPRPKPPAQDQWVR